jgi:hypothetical protein
VAVTDNESDCEPETMVRVIPEPERWRLVSTLQVVFAAVA